MKSLILLLSQILLSIWCLFRYLLNTVLPHGQIIILLSIWTFITLLILIIRNLKGKAVLKIGNLLFLPLTLLTLASLVNYAFSSETVIEKYSFKKDYEHINKSNSGPQQTSLIHLPQHNYEKAFGIRSFYNIEVIQGDSIELKFETGLMGFNVLTDYKFY